MPQYILLNGKCSLMFIKISNVFASVTAVCSAGFTHKIGRLKPRVSKSSGPLVMVYTIFDRLNVLTIHHPASKYTQTHVFLIFFYSLIIFSFVCYMLTLYFTSFLVHSQDNVMIIVYIKQDSIS